MSTSESKSVEVFFAYSHKDEKLRNELEKHLAILKRQGLITAWHDRRITGGREWEGQINEHLESAGVILLLVSADFLASDYCFDVELERAMKRHEAGDARVIPVILRAVEWSGAPFARLQALPKDAKPVTSWPNRDEAFADIAKGIRAALEEVVALHRLSFVAIPAGDFVMGSEVGEARERERPAHCVRISTSFHMSVAPVTVCQFERFIEATKHVTSLEKAWPRGKCCWRRPGFRQTGEHPVVFVSWQDASEYCGWLSEETGTTVRLPTEAEWEYACQDGDHNRWHFGDDEGSLLEFAWYRDNAGNGSREVGGRKPNKWGLHDMHGNVWEWCVDKYAGYPSGLVVDPSGPREGRYRVLRGGSWIDKARNTRASFRCRIRPTQFASNTGFRVVGLVNRGESLLDRSRSRR